MRSFHRYLCGLCGAFVQVERAGPEACQGWLAYVNTDYLTLRAASGEDLHLPLHHVRSVTRLPEPEGPLGECAATPPPATFAQLLALNLDRQIQLYHAGPELTVGILRESADHHLLVEVAPGETVCFALFHVRSLSVPTGASDILPMEESESIQGR